MKKVILFDIDYTLFDTYRFKRKIYEIVKDYFNYKKIDNLVKIIDEAYGDSRTKWGIFIPEKFTADLNIKLKANMPIDFVERKIHALNLFDTHHYKEVEYILKKLNKNKQIIIGIFSSGDEGFQKNKIKKIMKYLHKDHINIFMFKHDKLKEVFDKYKNYKLFIVDDFLDILDKINKLNKNAVTVWIKRKEKSEFNKVSEIKEFKPNYEIENLKELISIIKSN